MKEVTKENRCALDGGIDECCSIAESMIEEIHQIAVQECSIAPFAGVRHKGSFKKRLLRQIKQARKAAMMDRQAIPNAVKIYLDYCRTAKNSNYLKLF